MKIFWFSCFGSSDSFWDFLLNPPKMNHVLWSARSMAQQLTNIETLIELSKTGIRDPNLLLACLTTLGISLRQFLGRSSPSFLPTSMKTVPKIFQNSLCFQFWTGKKDHSRYCSSWFMWLKLLSKDLKPTSLSSKTSLVTIKKQNQVPPLWSINARPTLLLCLSSKKSCSQHLVSLKIKYFLRKCLSLDSAPQRVSLVLQQLLAFSSMNSIWKNDCCMCQIHLELMQPKRLLTFSEPMSPSMNSPIT